MNALRALRGSERGATLVEFALIAPVLFVFVFGVLDLGYGLYMQSVLQGVVQDAARDSGLESGKTNKNAIDQNIVASVRGVMPFLKASDIQLKRVNYESFSDVGVAEDFDDTNGNDEYDDTECFTDRNNNTVWDEDLGASGLGGADDVVYYQVDVAYDRLFPLWSLIGLSQRTTAQATTVLRSQPFGEQATRKTVRICPGA